MQDILSYSQGVTACVLNRQWFVWLDVSKHVVPNVISFNKCGGTHLRSFLESGDVYKSFWQTDNIAAIQ